MQNSEHPDNQFLVEKKDKCCGQKCGCHEKSNSNNSLMDGSLETYIIYGLFLFAAGVIIVLSLL